MGVFEGDVLGVRRALSMRRTLSWFWASDNSGIVLNGFRVSGIQVDMLFPKTLFSLRLAKRRAVM